MLIKVYYGHMLSRSAEDLMDFPKAGKMLLNHIFFIEGWGHIPAQDGGEVVRRCAAQAIQTLTTSATALGGQHFSLWAWNCDQVWR